MKFEIKDFEITMDKAITIPLLNFFDSLFVQFLGILSRKARGKEQLPKLENLAKFLEE